MSSKVYVGIRKGDFSEGVTVNGRKLFNYDRYGDPDNGFEWGYGGAGPTALALSILCDHFGVAPGTNTDQGLGHRISYVQDFKMEVIAQLPHHEGFTLTSEQVAEWVAKKEAESRSQTSRR